MIYAKQSNLQSDVGKSTDYLQIIIGVCTPTSEWYLADSIIDCYLQKKSNVEEFPSADS